MPAHGVACSRHLVAVGTEQIHMCWLAHSLTTEQQAQRFYSSDRVAKYEGTKDSKVRLFQSNRSGRRELVEG